MSHDLRKFRASNDITITAKQIKEITASSLQKVRNKAIHHVHFELLQRESSKSRKRSRTAIESAPIIISSKHNTKKLLDSKVFVKFYQTFDQRIDSFDSYLMQLILQHERNKQAKSNNQSNTKSKTKSKSSNKNKMQSDNENNIDDSESAVNEEPPTKRRKLNERRIVMQVILIVTMVYN